MPPINSEAGDDLFSQSVRIVVRALRHHHRTVGFGRLNANRGLMAYFIGKSAVGVASDLRRQNVGHFGGVWAG